MRKVILGSSHNLGVLIKKVLFWHLNYYLFKNPRPIACGIYITNRCNLRCQMCNIWRNPKKKTIPLVLYRNIIDDLERLGCYYVSLTGGEPLLVEDLDQRLIYAKKKIPYVHMVTNGFQIDEFQAKKLARTGIDEISISLDGLQKRHDTIRGVKGSFDRAWRAIENLKKHAPRIVIVVNSIISTHNIHDLYEVSRLVRENSLLHKFQPRNDHPVFEGQSTRSTPVKCNREEIQEIKKFVRFILPMENVVNSRYFLKQIPNYFSQNTMRGIFEGRCIFGYHHCEIKEDGTLFPCLTGMNWQRGFPLKEGLLNTIYSKEYRGKLEELKKCKLCKTNMYICYFEPRITFPLSHYFKYRFLEGTIR
ncbi:MAG: radical SAM protein [bacterium]